VLLLQLGVGGVGALGSLGHLFSQVVGLLFSLLAQAAGSQLGGSGQINLLN